MQRFSFANSRYTTQHDVRIDMTPLVGVMLVLLIIFMVSIPAATVSIKLDLPPANAPSTPLVKKPVFISIMGPDQIYIGDVKTDHTRLIADLQAALQSPNPFNERILVRGDKDIKYDDFVAVINQLQQNGFLKIGLINEDIE